MTTVIVCAGGPEREICSFEPYIHQSDVLFIGVDLGTCYLINRGIIPHVAVGDFDSLTEQQWNQVSRLVPNIERYDVEKDETDTDLALLKALSFYPTEIILTGVTGGRLDHYEAMMRTLYTMQLDYPQVVWKVINVRNEIQFLQPGTYVIEKNDVYRYISFFAFQSDVVGVTLRGVKYETTDEDITIGMSRFTSNELIEQQASISFQSGICLVIRSTD